MFMLNKVLQLLVVRLASVFDKKDQVQAVRLLGKIAKAITGLAHRVIEIYHTDAVIRHQLATLRAAQDEFFTFAQPRVELEALVEKVSQVAHETGLDGNLHFGVIVPVKGPQSSARQPAADPLGKFVHGRHNLN